MKKTAVCSLIAIFTIFISSCAMKPEPDVTFQQDLFDGLVKITEYSEKIVCESDIDLDGRKEKINIDYSEALSNSADTIVMTIEDSDSQDIIWQDYSLALPAAGWKQYYIVEIDDAAYLMRYYEPQERQGTYSYCCSIFNLGEDGNEVMYYEESGNTKDGIEAFVNSTSDYLNNAYLLISTANGNLKNAHGILKRY